VDAKLDAEVPYVFELSGRRVSITANRKPVASCDVPPWPAGKPGTVCFTGNGTIRLVDDLSIAGKLDQAWLATELKKLEAAGGK
jgi:hypothetical protein